MRSLIEHPETFWPGDDRFATRNRFKIERALTHLPDSKVDVLIDEFVDLLLLRRARGTSNLMAMSNGSSGCHYLGELLNELPGFRMTDEIYFPPAYLKAIDTDDLIDGGLALDFIDVLHTGSIDRALAETRVVNIGHLRADARPQELRRLGYRPWFLLLLRNPFDVTTSRAFRKTEYRSETDPSASDEDYLRKQAIYTAGFLKRAELEDWDITLTYERLTTDSASTLMDLGTDIGTSLSLDSVARAVRKFDAKSGDSQSVNLNTDSRPILDPEQQELLDEHLEEIAAKYGYTSPAKSERDSTASIQRSKVPNTGTRVLLPLYAEEFHYTETRYLAFKSGRLRVFRNVPETAFVEDADWTHDPLRSKTWRLYYHSLSWLLALAWGADHSTTRDAEVGQMKSIVDSYLSSNVLDQARDDMAWDDHAVADRLSTLVYLYRRFLADQTSPGEAERYEDAFERHVDRLLDFYQTRKWIDSNHGIFHAVALINAGLTLRNDERRAVALESGKQYLLDVVANMVAPEEGISLERSMGYHEVNLELLRHVTLLLDGNHMEGSQNLNEVVEAMIQFTAASRGTRNQVVSLGDTPFGARLKDDTMGALKNSQGSRDVGAITSPRAGHDLRLYPQTGWALFREGEVNEGREPATRAFFTFAEERGPHGHFDALSFSLQEFGHDLLIDSGGPYGYGEALRFQYFVAPRGHNTILVDGADHTGGGALVSSGRVPGLDWVVAEHRGFSGVRLTRAVLHLGGMNFVVVDGSSPTDTERAFQTLWHLNPEATIDYAMGPGRSFVDVDTAGNPMTLRTFDPSLQTLNIRKGTWDGVPFGWVTSRVGTKEEAPTVILESTSLQHFGATVVSASASDVSVSIVEKRCEIVGPGGQQVVVRNDAESLIVEPD